MKPAKAAVIQACPVLFDRDKTIEKACDLIYQARKADIILLFEAFIPAYPRGFGFGMRVGSRDEKGRDLWQLYFDNSLAVPGPQVTVLAKAARAAQAYVCIGVIEQGGASAPGTLYCTDLYFGPDGTPSG